MSLQTQHFIQASLETFPGNRFLQDREIFKASVEAFAAIPGHESKRHIAFGKHRCHRVNRLPAEIKIKNGAIEFAGCRGQRF